MENKTKAQTFIGFTIRTGKFRIGLNAVQTLKKIKLLIVCKSASENTKDKAKSIKNKYACPMLITVSHTLDQLTSKENAKVMAVTDDALAKAIIENSEKDFIAID